MDALVDRPKDRPVNEQLDEYDIPRQEGDDRLLAEARKRMVQTARYWWKTFELGQDDVTYTYLSQWPEEVQAQRQAARRPALTVNALPQFIQSTVANLYQQTMGIKFVTAGGIDGRTASASDRFTKITLAQLLSGIVRKIEVRSDAAKKYTRAAQHAVEAGIGWLMVEVRPDPMDPFNDELYISHVRNRWSVLADENAVEPDLSDMRYAFVSEMIPIGEFRVRYPDFYKEGRFPLDSSFEVPTLGDRPNIDWWGKDDHVRVFDYYYKEVVEKEFIELVHPETLERIVNRTDVIGKYVDDLEKTGFEVKRRKKAKCDEVRVVRCTREHILEDPIVWPGSRIPLIPVIGRQVDLSETSIYVGLVRYAVEPQIMRNTWATAATEKVASSPRNPWLIAKQQLQTVKGEWDRMAEANPTYLPYDAVEDATGRFMPPPVRDNQATMPTAELNMAGWFSIAIQEAMGIYAANLGQPSNETSGVAISRRQEAGSASQIGFGYNLATAVRSLGEVLLELIPQVYNDDRLVTIVDQEGEDRRYHVNHYVIDEGGEDPNTGEFVQGTGEKFLINCLAASRYDLRVDIGPASITAMEEFRQVVEAIFQNQPQIAPLVADLLFKSMPIPHADTIAERCRKVLLPPQLLSDRELQDRPPPEPTPEQLIQEAKTKEAEFSMKEAEVRFQGQTEVAKYRTTEQKQRIVAANKERENKAMEEETLDEADVRKIVQEEVEKVEKRIPTEVRKEVAAHERTKE